MIRAMRQLRRIKLIAVLARILRAVHGQISLLQQVYFAFTRHRIQRNANARVQHERAASHVDLQFLPASFALYMARSAFFSKSISLSLDTEYNAMPMLACSTNALPRTSNGVANMCETASANSTACRST